MSGGAGAKRYTAAPGSRLRDEDAAVIGETVERLSAERGAARAKDLLEEARDPASPVHGYFEWDDAKAAEAHRLERARFLIRSIRIVVQTEEAPIETRAFHVVTQDESRGYRPAEQVFASETLAAQVVGNALRELRGWSARYQAYRAAARLAPVFEAIDEALAEPARDGEDAPASGARRADEAPDAAE